MVLSESGDKLLDGDPCVSKNCTERAFRYFSMIRNSNSSVRSRNLSQDDVATTLSVNFIAESLKCSDNLAPRDDGQFAQVPTSTISSLIDGGTGSPRSSRLSI